MEAAAPDVHARPQADGSDIRKVDEENADAVAAAVARAFYDDPVMTWCFPDDGRRLRRLERGFDLWLRKLWLPHGECYTTDRFAGGALWVPPGKAKLGIGQQLRMVPGMVARIGWDLPRTVRFLNLMDRNHPHEDHYYLPAAGVAPEWQGRGFGAALLRPILERCDAEGVPAYLESTTPRNRALYERNGFRVTAEVLVGGDGPPVWLMWRDPQG